MATASATGTTSDHHRAGRLDLTGAVLVAVGLGQVLPGLLAFLAPGAFYELLGPYPPENAHFVKDLGSWQIALGLAALAAAAKPAWRRTMLAILALQYVLHTISHVIDADVAEPRAAGTFALVSQLLGAVVLTALLVKERRR